MLFRTVRVRLRGCWFRSFVSERRGAAARTSRSSTTSVNTRDESGAEISLGDLPATKEMMTAMHTKPRCRLFRSLRALFIEAGLLVQYFDLASISLESNAEVGVEEGRNVWRPPARASSNRAKSRWIRSWRFAQLGGPLLSRPKERN